ncbi:FUSC family protein [Massilia sp. 9096]|uniref:FUSC family protein n=1 Tax=Massilia sp. 9096 TaxID=1500894 RepID=UPI000562A32D|nr:FUSC family protein [Massilia sp. 9096]
MSDRNPDLIRYLLDRLIASDPARDRFRSALRALLTALVSAGVFLLITRQFDLEYKLSLCGIVVPMIAVVAMQDPGRSQQKETMAWVPVLASAALIVGTLVAENPWLSGALFLLTIFGAFQMRRFGPRGGGLGVIAYQSFFFALLFKTPPDKMLWDPVFVFIGCAIGYAVHFWLVPERPGRVLHGEVHAYRARIAALLHDLARWLDAGAKSSRADKASQKRIDAHLAALNAQSLALDTRLAGFTQGREDGDGKRLREQVLRCELAAETIADVARSLHDDPAARRALAAALRALEAASARQAQPLDARAWEAALPPTLPDDARWRLGQAARVLTSSPPWRAPLPAMGDEHKPQQAQQSAPTTAKMEGGKGSSMFDDTTRRALQAAAAALAALLIGHLTAPQHWYWAVFSAFIVFTRAATVGQTFSSAWRQVLASLAGLCIGVVCVQVVQGSQAGELALLFLFVAIGFYAFKGVQNLYTMMLTAMLAMLWELMGMDSASLLLLRLGETTAGGVSAVLAAHLVLPVHTQDESDSKGADLLHAAGHLLAAALEDGEPKPLYLPVRDLDRKLQALRQTLGPVTHPAYPGASDGHRQQLRQLARIAFCVRHFYNLVVSHGSTGHAALAHAHAVQARARALAPELDAVAARLEAPGALGAQPVQPGPSVAVFPPLDQAAADGFEGGNEGGADERLLRIATRWLQEADGLLRPMLSPQH